MCEGTDEATIPYAHALRLSVATLMGLRVWKSGCSWEFAHGSAEGSGWGRPAVREGSLGVPRRGLAIVEQHPRVFRVKILGSKRRPPPDTRRASRHDGWSEGDRLEGLPNGQAAHVRLELSVRQRFSHKLLLGPTTLV